MPWMSRPLNRLQQAIPLLLPTLTLKMSSRVRNQISPLHKNMAHSTRATCLPLLLPPQVPRRSQRLSRLPSYISSTSKQTGPGLARLLDTLTSPQYARRYQYSAFDFVVRQRGELRHVTNRRLFKSVIVRAPSLVSGGA